MKIKRFYSNRYIGRIPKGCRVCSKGAKLVLFVTGICYKGCFYCPLSEKRRGKDVVYANERPVRNVEDILEEAKIMKARGAGITGGEPYLRFERVIKFIKLLKKNFGEDFHIHMYTAVNIPKNKLKELKEAGLDEIRYHLLEIESDVWESVENASSLEISTGIEIPSLPNDEERIVKIIETAKERGAEFVNINELEFSHTNSQELIKRGYKLKSMRSYAVKYSRETALKAMERCKNLNINIHFCSSRFKDTVQLKNRLRRMARTIKKPFEIVTNDGLLLKGIIEDENKDISFLEDIIKYIINRYKFDEKYFYLNVDKKRIETSVEIVKFLSKNFKRKGLRYYIIEEYPTYDRIETERIEL